MYAGQLRAPHIGEREQIVAKHQSDGNVLLELNPSLFHCTTTETEDQLRRIGGVTEALHDGNTVTIALEPDKSWDSVARLVQTALERCFEHGVKFIDAEFCIY